MRQKVEILIELQALCCCAAHQLPNTKWRIPS